MPTPSNDLTPEELVKIMRSEYAHDYDDDMEGVLRIVLQAIRDGEVVDHTIIYHNGVSGEVSKVVRFKPSFAKMLEVEK